MNSARKIHRGVFLLYDGGYHRWPILTNPHKDAIPGSPTMQWSAKLEFVRKDDIEGVFGILKKRFKFLKNFNVLQMQSGIDNAFTTCCIIHNIQPEHDSHLGRNLTPLLPGGLEGTMGFTFGNQRWNGLEGIWVCDDDDEDDDSNFVHDPSMHLGRCTQLLIKQL